MENNSWHNSRSRTALFSFVLATIIIFSFIIFSYFGKQLVGLSEKFTLEATDRQVVQKPVDIPKKLFIPSIAVETLVQEIGIDGSGRMGIPSNFTDVAWYKLGSRPGEIGSAVIDGHLDTAVDANAVFIRLNELKTGDEIDVVDKSGQKIVFRVTETEIYDDANAPLDKIFDRSGRSARLNLITCDGVWNQKVRNYDKRLVVYSERVLD